MLYRLIDDKDKDSWNNFIANSRNSPVLQSFEWGEVKKLSGWEPIRIAVFEQDQIVAAASILKREIPYIKHCLFYCPRGPVLDFNHREILDFLLAAIEKEAEKYHAISLKIDPDLDEGSHQLLKTFGFEKSHKQVQPRVTYIIDLDRELDEILMSFEEKTRYNVRLAEKKGVSIKENAGDEGIEAFYQIYQETSKRDQFLIHPKKYYHHIRRIMFENGLGTCFLAYYDNKPVAGVIVFCFGKKIWYMYGASSAQYRNYMPNHLLHWEIIKWAKEKAYKLYDLWGIPAKPCPEHPLFGVYRFKKGFNGQLVKNIGAYDFPYSHMLYYGLEYGVMGIQAVRSLLTKGRIEDPLGE